MNFLASQDVKLFRVEFRKKEEIQIEILRLTLFRENGSSYLRAMYRHFLFNSSRLCLNFDLISSGLNSIFQNLYFYLLQFTSTTSSEDHRMNPLFHSLVKHSLF